MQFNTKPWRELSRSEIGEILRAFKAVSGGRSPAATAQEGLFL